MKTEHMGFFFTAFTVVVSLSTYHQRVKGENRNKTNYGFFKNLLVESVGINITMT